MRDFTQSIDDQRPNSGGANKFLKFLENELIPYIDANYRTRSFRTLCGHSLCGMFSIYTLFTKPKLFNVHIAISPYLMYDNEYVLNQADSVLAKQSIFNNYLYITLGNEPDYFKSIKRLNKLLKNKTEKLQWKYSKREQEDHGSVPLISLYDGIEFIYSGWRVPAEVASAGIDGIKKHYNDLSVKYGYTIEVQEAYLNRLGYQFMAQDHLENAIAVFKYNVELNSNSANVYDSLGEGLESNNQFDLALKNYQKAVELGKAVNDPNTNVYQDHIKRVQKKLKK